MSEGGSKGERRSSPRVLRRSILVHRAMEYPEPPGTRGRLRDISPTGVRFESEREYPMGELLKLEMSLPGWEKEKIEFSRGDPREDLRPLVALAEVRWVSRMPEGVFEVGAAFVNIDEWHRKALERYVEKLDAEGQGRR